MLLALFTSRVILSAGFGAFVLVTCVHKDFGRQFLHFIKNPFLLGVSLFFFIPFISGLWSSDGHAWLRFARIKLPLFLFPLAFAGQWQLSEKQWNVVAYFFLVLVFAGCCWSGWYYFQNAHLVHDEYLKAKIFRTPLEDDHIRFSLLVTIAVMLSIFMMQRTTSRVAGIVTGTACVLFIVYLHLLAARTGLISLYVFLICAVFYLLFTLRKTRWTLLLLGGIIVLPLLAWLSLPTFQNRVRYNLYDLSNAWNGQYVQGTNDGTRIYSVRAGWDILKVHPFGVGADLSRLTHQWYDRNMPQLPSNARLLPANEPLMYAGFAGWIGMLLFLFILSLPFFQKKQNAFFWITINIIMTVSFFYEVGLESQFGIFVYAFVVLWWWKWLRKAGSLIRSH